MSDIVNINSSSEEFFKSKRLFSLTFIAMLNKKGADFTRNELEKFFNKTTFLLFPMVLTPENLEETVMNFKFEEVKFK